MRAYTALTEKFKTLSPVLNEHCGRLWQRPKRSAGAVASVPRRGQQDYRAQQFTRIERSTPAQWRRLGRPRASHGRGEGARSALYTTRRCCTMWKPWSSPRPRRPQSLLRWDVQRVSASSRRTHNAGDQVSPQLVSELLHAADYSFTRTRKTREGAITRMQRTIRASQRPGARLSAHGQPSSLSMPRRRNFLGDFKMLGREWHPRGILPRSVGMTSSMRSSARPSLRRLRRRRQPRVGQRGRGPACRPLRTPDRSSALSNT